MDIERLKSFIQGRYSILFSDIDSFINTLYMRPLKAVIVNRRLIGDPIVLEQYFSRMQKRIIRNIYRILEPGGLLIYSTCTFTIEECEEAVDYAIKLRFDVIKPANIPFQFKWGISEWNGRSFDRRVKYSVRISPEMNKNSYAGNIGLLYLAVLKKMSGS